MDKGLTMSKKIMTVIVAFIVVVSIVGVFYLYTTFLEEDYISADEFSSLAIDDTGDNQPKFHIRDTVSDVRVYTIPEYTLIIPKLNKTVESFQFTSVFFNTSFS